MAKYLVGSAIGPGAGDAFFLALVDHMVTNGWTILHQISVVPGSRNYVLRGGALDAVADNRPFVRFEQTSSTIIQIRCYQDWDEGAVTGINEAGSTATVINVQDASFNYWIRANPVAVGWCTKIGTTYYKYYVGYLRRKKPLGQEGITKTTAAVAVGATSLPVASDMTGKLYVGQRVQIYSYAHNNASANKGNVETVTVTSIAPASIGVSATTKAYDAGALVGWFPHPIGIIGASTGNFNGTMYFPIHLDGTRTSAVGQTGNCYAYYPNGLGESNVDPEGLGGYIGFGYNGVYEADVSRSGFRGEFYHWMLCAGTTQVYEDIMQEADGSRDYVILFSQSGGDQVVLGPRD